MDKGRSNHIAVVLLGIAIWAAEWQVVLAENQSTSLTTTTTTTTASGAAQSFDMTSFNNWLKENKQPVMRQDFSHDVSSRGLNNGQHHHEAAPIVIGSRPLTLQESQQIMLDSAPPSPPPSAEATLAFNGMMQKNMPLTPEQVVKLKQLIDVSQRAAAISPTVPPKPVSTTLMINLAPGSTPPAIRLAQGYVSSLVFVDSSGLPWPIASYDLGDPKATVVQWDGKSNVMLIQGVSPYGDSNLVIRLVGLPTPITLELVSGQRVVDYRADIHVAGAGPNTKDLPTGVSLPSNANQLLLNVLEGVAPPASKQLAVRGGDCQAWVLDSGRMYLRTRLTVLSPGWIGKMVSPDGMNAYEIQKSSSILVSQYGQPIELKIEGF